MKKSKKFPKVCIIVLNWNGKDLLKDCLSSLFKLTKYPNYKVIVVDNGSVDGSVKYVKKTFKSVEILAFNKNYGVPVGINKGVEYCFKKFKPKYIVYLNNDIEIVDNYWLRKIVEFSETDEKIGLIGCKALTLDKKVDSTCYVDGKNLRKIVMQVPTTMVNEICENFITGACLLVKKTVFEKIGGFDKIYTPYMWEDVDFYWRAKKAGFRLFYFGKTKVIHKISQTLKKEENVKKIFFSNRNETIFYLRYDKKLIPIKFLKIFARCLVTKDPKTGYKNWVIYRNFLARFFVTLKAIYFAFKIYKKREVKLIY